MLPFNNTCIQYKTVWLTERTVTQEWDPGACFIQHMYVVGHRLATNFQGLFTHLPNEGVRASEFFLSQCFVILFLLVVDFKAFMSPAFYIFSIACSSCDWGIRIFHVLCVLNCLTLGSLWVSGSNLQSNNIQFSLFQLSSFPTSFHDFSVCPSFMRLFKKMHCGRFGENDEVVGCWVTVL